MTFLENELLEPEYFCLGVGGVVRDVAWITQRLKYYQIDFQPGELATALTMLIIKKIIRTTLTVTSDGAWHIGFTLV